jgi:G patch domain-containing protein 1
MALKPPENSVFNRPINKMPSLAEFDEAPIKQEPEAEGHEADSSTLNEVISEQKSEDSLLEFPDPPAKIDLYKAIFLSSSEDSDSDNEEDSSANLIKESKSEEITLSKTNKTDSLLLESVPQEEDIVSSNTVTSAGKNIQRNLSPPRGVFANLDLDAINAQIKGKSNTAHENKKQTEISKSKQTANEDHTEHEQNSRLDQTGKDMYGPQLPSVPLSVSKNTTSVPTVNKVLSSVVASVYNEWVEKTNDSHKSKHNKKHKKSSKHKKHKHKKKRH